MGDSGISNDFFWSRSRSQMFRECLRKYYLNYYGYWGGWDRGADERIQKIYRLKKLQSRYMWLGTAVHEAVEKALHFLKTNRQPDPDDVIDEFVRKIRDEFRESRQKKYHQNPKRFVGLTEHEYDEEIEDDEWVHLRERGKDCIRTFFESSVYGELRQHPPDRFLAIEGDLASSESGPDRVMIRNTPVFLKLDLAYRSREGEVRVVDWKTGSTGGTRDQLLCYGYYAWKNWNVDPEDLDLRFYNLHVNEETREEVRMKDLEDFEQSVYREVLEMKESLADPENNTADESDFPMIDDLQTCRRCRFRGICYPEGLPE